MNKENQFQYMNTRITVLFPGVIRVESGKHPKCFTHEATQAVWYRDFKHVACDIRTEGKRIYIHTALAEVCINAKTGKMIFSKTNAGISRRANEKNLRGTARTLDQCAGAILLQPGVISKSGTAILDDSKSLLVGKDGEVLPREAKGTDYYIFAYGDNYVQALQALYQICGPAPFIPRYALGNWWSRYKAYTREEYQELMNRFEKEEVPLSVATVDMYWHWVDIKSLLNGKKIDLGKKNLLGAGWTGYSWNTNLFPDYKGFLAFLKEKQLKVTLNLHPASGVRCFEEQYEVMANELGIDAGLEQAIDFDVTNRRFMEAYFKHLHHPYEEDGVDFWWIDWQQGKKTAIKGLDPLWALNHYHYLSADRGHKRPLILSRYSGIGSHRYPLGFSGDTWIRWSALRFQPYFTATAANCGYTWWSHDIGGHIFGGKDEELYARWIQFGVFSPICRLHSSNVTKGKEPWNYSGPICEVAKEYLRLRKKLIPYIYTMNYRIYTEGRALCEPLYYTCKEKEAYQYKNEYMFGSQLLVCPVTSKRKKGTQKAVTKVYLPKGRWTHFFTGEVYDGEQTVLVESGLREMPVFAKEGAIIPLCMDKGNGVANPEKILWKIYPGKGTFDLYEDDGETKDYIDGKYSISKVKQTIEQTTLRLQLDSGKKADYMPEKREHIFLFENVFRAEKIVVKVNGEEVQSCVEWSEMGLKIHTEELSMEDSICIELKGVYYR